MMIRTDLGIWGKFVCLGQLVHGKFPGYRQFDFPFSRHRILL
jgi:hypothetical protein